MIKKIKSNVGQYITIGSDAHEAVDLGGKVMEIGTIVTGCLSATFGLLTVNILTSWTWAYILMWILIGFVIIYAIVDSIKTGINK